MAQVNHDTVAVHLLYDLFSELAHTVMGVASACGITDIVVAVVAQGDVNDAALGEVFHVGKVVVQRKPVLNAQHNALAPFALVAVKVGGRAGDADKLAVFPDDILNFVKDKVGIAEGCQFAVLGLLVAPGYVHHLGKLLADLGLRQISHHDNGILPPILHLVHVNEYARVALVEMYSFVKEHRRVAMCVKSYDALM